MDNDLFSTDLSFFLIVLFIVSIGFGKENSKNEDFLKVNKDTVILYDFKNPKQIDEWFIVNDGVMGGFSQSKITLGEQESAIFNGNISLENNGGFASTGTRYREYHLAKFNGILLRVKGDGKTYQFRLREGDQLDGISYRYHFKTENEKWLIVKIPFEECVPVFRGKVLKNVGNVSPEQIQQIGFLISDKQAGEFQLEIKWIKAYQ